MKKARDLTGNKYGRLTVVSRAESKTRRIKWNCICECGNTSIVSGENLMSGHTKSCGCLLSERRTSHGKSKTRLYNIWRKMKSRCTNKNETHYNDYGGRGIEVCPRWFSSFDNFYNDMIEGYDDSLCIDRINNDGNYEPGNCRWVTRKVNSRNTRASRFIDGHNLAEYCEKYNIPKNRVISRITKNGWDEKEALYTPKQRGRYGVHNSTQPHIDR